MEALPLSSPAASGTATRKRETSAMSRLKKRCLSCAVSVGEIFRYLKAIAVGQTKKMMAKTEKEATEADLQTAKMQVEAADEAENIKKRLD
ncbi:uncharacterized protein LOC111386891 [Olea europaea var. sylvestris]|uniref:Uncharacterized protein n=1 Tax=Olea europaea subsp. europaea TaxID=158383 RepID=A0A8S0SHB2_OLEEU|nr:uncharacterized protein LOC111386891 [Olea europaea var. sylvestris]CAA2991241.1 Hypothetical predicted protein [Olea europaea subsp. europaea]